MAETLAGLRVVELTGGRAVSYCTKLLAGLGADVIKVESPDGDICRSEGPFRGDLPDPEASGIFLHLNTGKRGVTVDVERAAGRDLVRHLLEEADVVVEGFRPGGLAALGFGFEALSREQPRLILTSITPFGQEGPYAQYKGGELVAYALGGYMMITGSPEREPLKAYSTQIEFQAGLQGAVGTMVALAARDADGRGDWVDVSAMEAATFLLGGPAQVCALTGEIRVRNGTRLIGLVPRYFYPSTLRPCRDGFVHAHTNIRHPDLMAVLMDQPRLVEPDLLEEPAGNADEIDALMDEMAEELRPPRGRGAGAGPARAVHRSLPPGRSARGPTLQRAQRVRGCRPSGRRKAPPTRTGGALYGHAMENRTGAAARRTQRRGFRPLAHHR